MSKSIHTERLELRPFQNADAARVVDLIGNLAVSRWLTRVPHPYETHHALDFFAKSSHQETTYAVVRQGELIGGCSLREELGYWLGQDYWGVGYAFEAAFAVVAAHFAATSRNLQSGHFVENIASGNVLNKLGFQNTDQRESHCLALDRTVTVQKMTLTAAAWAARA